MSEKIVRTKTKALGGITEEEKVLMVAHSKMWIARAMRTEAIEPDKIIPAIKGLYRVADLAEPHVIIASSPLTMAFGYGGAAAICFNRSNKDSKEKVEVKWPKKASGVAAQVLKVIAQAVNGPDAPLPFKISNDPEKMSPEKAASKALKDLVGEFGITCAKRWSNVYQGGNMWAGYESYLTACRDILGLELEAHKKYVFWEQAAIHGGFRVMHEEFCIVSDFPDTIKIDDQNRPHAENGPSHRWRDGWSLYHWHGTKIPGEWIEDKSFLTASVAMKERNVELRRSACEIVGWAKILRDLDSKTIDKDDDPQIGELVSVKLPDLPDLCKFLRVECGTGREFAIGIPSADERGKPITTALEAQAWIRAIPPKELILPEVRA